MISNLMRKLCFTPTMHRFALGVDNKNVQVIEDDSTDISEYGITAEYELTVCT